MAFTDSVKYPALQELLSAYFYPDDERIVVSELAERVKADNPANFIAAVHRDIQEFLSKSSGDANVSFRAEFLSYYFPGGDGLTVRQWLEVLDAHLTTPPDLTRDHRSGRFS